MPLDTFVPEWSERSRPVLRMTRRPEGLTIRGPRWGGRFWLQGTDVIATGYTAVGRGVPTGDLLPQPVVKRRYHQLGRRGSVARCARPTQKRGSHRGTVAR
jgi:hypothetical protein